MQTSQVDPVEKPSREEVLERLLESSVDWLELLKRTTDPDNLEADALIFFLAEIDEVLG